MDGARFDRWTRLLATGRSRRQTVRLLAGGALGGLLVRLGVEEAAGQATCTATGGSCGKPADCCSGHCSSATRTCCLPKGAKTRNAAKCCSGMRKKSTGRCTCKPQDATCDAATAHKCCSGRCEGGKCGPPCQSDTDCPGKECHDPDCVETTGTCMLAVTAGATCEDGNQCTVGDTCDANGTCTAGSPRTCNDNNPCTTDSCDPSSGCQFQNVPDDSFCSTAQVPIDGRCRAGQCVAKPNCIARNGICVFVSGRCCSNDCTSGGTCACSTSREDCRQNSDCCSGLTCIAYQCRVS